MATSDPTLISGFPSKQQQFAHPVTNYNNAYTGAEVEEGRQGESIIQSPTRNVESRNASNPFDNLDLSGLYLNNNAPPMVPEMNQPVREQNNFVQPTEVPSWNEVSSAPFNTTPQVETSAPPSILNETTTVPSIGTNSNHKLGYPWGQTQDVSHFAMQPESNNSIATPAIAHQTNDTFNLHAASVQSNNTALSLLTQPNNDPFGVHNTAPTHNALVETHNHNQHTVTPSLPPSEAPQSPVQVPHNPPPAENNDDFWETMGFSLEQAQTLQATAGTPPPVTLSSPKSTTNSQNRVLMDISEPCPQKLEATVPDLVRQTWDGNFDKYGFPAGGKYYETRINTVALGALFMTATELKNDFYREMPLNLIDALNSVPVISYVMEKSGAVHGGLEVGHVIARVNDDSPRNPAECANMIKYQSRPLKLTVYIPPNLKLSSSDLSCKVKYDTRDLVAPVSPFEWKAKYVVLGGVVAKPYALNMYRNKVSLDIRNYHTKITTLKSIH